MASLNSIYIKKETLKTILEVLEKKGEKGIEITVSINDDANQFGQNIAAYVSQSANDRQAQKPKFYVGNGRTFWTDGKISTVNQKQEELKNEHLGDDDDFPL